MKFKWALLLLLSGSLVSRGDFCEVEPLPENLTTWHYDHSNGFYMTHSGWSWLEGVGGGHFLWNSGEHITVELHHQVGRDFYIDWQFSWEIHFFSDAELEFAPTGWHGLGWVEYDWDDWMPRGRVFWFDCLDPEHPEFWEPWPKYTVHFKAWGPGNDPDVAKVSDTGSSAILLGLSALLIGAAGRWR